MDRDTTSTDNRINFSNEGLARRLTPDLPRPLTDATLAAPLPARKQNTYMPCRSKTFGGRSCVKTTIRVPASQTF